VHLPFRATVELKSMTLRIVEPADSDPVSLAEAKAQLRAADSSNDVVIKGLIPAATKFVQSIVQRVFVQQTLEWVLPCWRAELCIPVAPVVAAGIKSIKYVDWTTRAQLTLDPGDYVIQPRGPSVAIFTKFGGFWPVVFAHSSEPIVVRFEAGYEDADEIPANVKVAILLQIRHLYSMGERNPSLTKDLVFGLGEKQFQIPAGYADLIPDVVTSLVFDEAW